MLNFIKRNMFSTLTLIIALIATTNVSAYSSFYLYEPEVPESLKK